MFSLPDITSAREIQRNYRKLFDRVKRTKRPLLVMKDNKPDVVIMGVKKLEEMEAVMAVLQSREEAQQGKTKVLKSLKDLR